MSEERIVFSSPLAIRIRTGKPHFESDESRFKSELAKKYRETGGKVSAARVHPDIVKFCSDYWFEQARRLQFETNRSFGECSREVALREPFVYFSRAAVGEFHEYDVTVPHEQEDDE